MLKLKQILRETGLSKKDFYSTYLSRNQPVIFTDLMDSWPAKNKWTIDYLKSVYGHLKVPLYATNKGKGKKYISPEIYMTFKEYLELLEAGPTNLRMFLFNIFKEAPELIKDFSMPTIMDGFIDSFPFMFFGGEGATVGLHYDIDLSHIFLNQLHGRKRVVLFAPDQSINIYHHPFSVASYIDVNNPDYDLFPALEKAVGYECIVNPGETLFMPSGYWHYIEYLDSGFSMSLRANESYLRRGYGLLNIAKHFVVDKGMFHLLGKDWIKIKAKMAKRRAEKII
ncbi:MAG TPA: cupin-like domain-containing protein [Saprospiraceae bacterium]|nr:cupin-like domain-containing protein [Saprospiraceae bacterium]